MIDPSTFLAGGFVLGLAAALWSKIRALAARALSYAVVTVDVEDSAAVAVLAYCRTHLARSPYGPRRYRGDYLYVRPEARRLVVAYEALGTDATLFWARWRPVLLHRVQQETSKYQIGSAPVRVTFARGTFDADALVTAAVDAYNAAKHGLVRDAFDAQGNLTVDPVPVDRRYRVNRFHGSRLRPSYTDSGPSSKAADARNVSDPDDGPGRRLLKWAPADVGEPIPEAADPLGYMALTQEQEALTKDCERWLASKAWFEARGVPWRMGALLWGAPGAGKSSYVRAICQRLDLPVFTFDLSTFDNESFVHKWDELLSYTPCAAVIEDVDAVFNGRENVTAGENPGLSFDCLLNRISGVAESSGVLLFVTTNHPEGLDPALGRPTDSRVSDVASGSTRPGRIDRTVEFGALTEAGRRHIAGRILAGYPGDIERCVHRGTGSTGAVFEDLCVRTALDRYWERPQEPK